MKRPYFPFFPGDWLRDGIAGCSLTAQGLWLRMMLVMHDSETYGVLVVAGQKMTDEAVARRCGTTLKTYRKCLQELVNAGVPSLKPDGTIYSRRMVRDEEQRRQDAERKAKGKKDSGSIPDGFRSDSGEIPESFHPNSTVPSASPSASEEYKRKASEIDPSGNGRQAEAVGPWLARHGIDGPLHKHVTETPGVTAELLEAARLKAARFGNPAAIACYRVCKKLGRPIAKRDRLPEMDELLAIRNKRNL